MADSLHRDEVRRNAHPLVEVLPAAEHDEAHLPGAVNAPLKTLGPKAINGARPVASSDRLPLGWSLHRHPRALPRR